MIYTDLQIIDAEDRVYGFTNGRPFSLETLLVDNPVKQPTLLMRRRVIDRLKGVDERLHYTMDREFWLRMHMAGFTIRYIPGWVNARFRLVEGTKTHTHTPRFRQEWLQVMEQAFREEFFRTVDSALLRRAIRVNRSSYELSLMNRAFDGGRRGRGLVHAANALFRDASLAFNAGFLGLLAKGLGGGDRDPTAKFKVGR